MYHITFVGNQDHGYGERGSITRITQSRIPIATTVATGVVGSHGESIDSISVVTQLLFHPLNVIEALTISYGVHEEKAVCPLERLWRNQLVP